MACVERQEKRNKEKSVSESRGPRHKAPCVSHSFHPHSSANTIENQGLWKPVKHSTKSEWEVRMEVNWIKRTYTQTKQCIPGARSSETSLPECVTLRPWWSSDLATQVNS